MDESERKLLAKLRRDAKEADALFSNDGQELQERTAVAGLLRVLGVEFREDEIIKRGPEPVDVWFRQARFQVTEILDEDRPRNLEIKRRSTRIQEARDISDLVEPGTISGLPMSPEELVARVLKRCRDKSQKYGGADGGIDLLVYVNLQVRHLFPPEPFPKIVEAECSGWRSVSVIMERFAIVLCASDDAPSFLIERLGQSVLWDNIDSVFPTLASN